MRRKVGKLEEDMLLWVKGGEQERKKERKQESKEREEKKEGIKPRRWKWR